MQAAVAAAAVMLASLELLAKAAAAQVVTMPLEILELLTQEEAQEAVREMKELA
jgi:hypothetical protein